MGQRDYGGSCHCGKVRYQVTMDLAEPVIVCNCSMCGRSGTMLAFVPVESFRLETDESALTDYQFGKKIIHHLFCATCGIKAFARGGGPGGKEMAAVNVRCLEGADLEALKVNRFDGKSR